MKGTVLVVDDMPIIRDPIAATLTAAGFRALRAGDGKQALEILRTQPVDLILLDVDMPVMNGISFLRVLRGAESTSRIAVIMLSAVEDREDILAAAKFGIKGYILKSHFSLKELLTRVTQHFTPMASAASPITQSKEGSSATVIATATKSAGAAPSGAAAPNAPREIVPLINREQCIERAKKALQGRTLSGVVSEVIAVAASPRGAASDLTSLIARDPLLSARVLQVANSSAYVSTRGVVSTLPEAVRNIGCAVIRNIAAAMGVFNAMPESDSDGLNLLRCWQHAFAVATLSQRLAADSDKGLAYLVGLCHDLGEILFQSQFAVEYRQVLEIQQSTGKPRDEVERIVLGMSHGDLLQTIVKCLELPGSISTPIQEYHSKGPQGTGGSAMTRLLRAADLYANGMLLASSNQSPIRPLTAAETIIAKDNPPQLDRAGIRGEILGLTATLSRFSEKQQSEVIAAPFPRRRVRIWLARDHSLSSLDPVEAALDLLAEVTPGNALPNADKSAEHDAILVTARTSLAAGLTSADLTKAATRPGGEPIPVLWLVGKVESPPQGMIPIPWPIPLAKLAEFIAAVPDRSNLRVQV